MQNNNEENFWKRLGQLDIKSCHKTVKMKAVGQ